MIQIYFVRHGETDWNHLGKQQGFSDIPLNETGLAQAADVGEALRDVHFDRAIVSDLVRARVTGEEILKGRYIPTTFTEALREINFGDWESLTYSEINQQWPGQIEAIYEDPSGKPIPNGETVEMVQERAYNRLLEELDKMEEGQRLVVVCHGGTIRTLLCALTGIPLNCLWRLAQGNTAVSVVDFWGHQSPYNRISILNDTSHTHVREGGYGED